MSDKNEELEYKIKEKARKLKALVDDRATTEGEKNSAQIRLDSILEKYPNLEFIREEEYNFYIKAKDIYEQDILISICNSYGIELFYVKNHSRLKARLYTTNKLHALIIEEFEYHKNILKTQIEMLVLAYERQFIFDPPRNPNAKVTFMSKEESEAFNNAKKFFETKDFSNKLKIDN